MTGPGTYWRTIRHLKAGQLVDRVAFRLRRPRPDLRPPPLRRARSGPWALPARRAPSLVPPSTFDLLNVRRDLDRVGWDDPGLAKLWRYHQHYFDDLNAHAAGERGAAHEALLARWIAENPPGQGSGWEPYPVSLRIVNWIKRGLSGKPLPAWADASLAVQARWLAGRLETHLLGNHLFANAKALVFAGLHFAGDEAEAWLHIGAAILERELAEQILADGGQFELSPMYHALALEDVLDLLNAIAALGPGFAPLDRLRTGLAARVPAMGRWLRALSHPDGTLGRFNDCADGVAPPTAELLRLAEDLGLPIAPLAPPDAGFLVLPDSGYLRVERGALVALLDLARVGPDYLPGHAHADTLSFELSLAGRAIVVNGGTSGYGDGAQRQRERSTAAHSTVEVDGRDSSEVWAGFRVGRRARPGPLALDAAAGRVACSHDGYAHLPGRPVHERLWQFEPGRMTVRDRVGNPCLPAVARYHLAPGLALSTAGPGCWAIEESGVARARVEVRQGRGRTEPSVHAPRFGVVCPTQCLAVDLDAGAAVTEWTWPPAP